MISTFSRIFLLVIVIFLASCGQKNEEYHEQLLVFGTIVDIKFWGVDEKKAEQVMEQVRQDFKFMHRAWHAWNAGATTRVNFFIANGKTFTGNPAVLPLIKRATQLSRQSGGLFNPAIGQLISLWGFASDDPPKGPPPSSEAIQGLLAQKPEMENITIEGVTIHCNNPAVQLNFGAFAKGYAVDRIIEYLREQGINNAVVNAGGDLRAIGQHGNRPWRVGIRHPRAEGILASLETTQDESVFTSGDYERYFDWQGKRYGHIIDPRTGRPADDLTSVTILADQADLADAAATALFVAGSQDWLPVARAMGIKGAMLVDNQGNIQITPGIRERIHFNVEPLPPIRVSEALR